MKNRRRPSPLLPLLTLLTAACSDSATDSRGAAAGTDRVANLGLATADARGNDELVAFSVSELAQGGADLNGDGDARWRAHV